MMGWFEGFLGAAKTGEQDPEYSGAIRKIEEALAGLPQEEARFLACVALLAARVADADTTVSDGEKQRIREVLKERLKLPHDSADRAASLAVEATLSRSVEQHLVLRRMNEIATREQKHMLVRALFHVACEADVSELENEEIRSIATALLLARSEFNALRLEFRDHLAVLKNLPMRRPAQ